MARKGATVTGIDLSDKALKVAELHSLESGVQVRYEKIAAEDLRCASPPSFDVVTCHGNAGTCPGSGGRRSCLRAAGKPGGQVFFSTLNRNPNRICLPSSARNICCALPKGTHDFAKFIKPAELGLFIRKATMTVQDIKGMTYNPLTNIFLNQDTSVNYMMAASRND